LQLARPPFVVAVSPAFEEDLALALEEVGDGSAGAVLTPCIRLPLIVAAIDKSLVLPAKCANHSLSLVASGPSAPNRLGVGASVKSWCGPWPDLEFEEECVEGVGVDAEKRRSERARRCRGRCTGCSAQSRTM
jgi:hypothetical protein